MRRPAEAAALGPTENGLASTRRRRHVQGMLARSLALCALTAFVVACGVPQEEHDKALADQKAAFDAEMKKIQAAHDDASKRSGNQISSLEDEVKKLGGNLAEVRAKAEKLDEQLGVKSSELASTQRTLVEKEAKLEATQTELDEVRKLRQQAEAAAKAFRDLAARLKSMVDAGKLEVVVRKGRMTVKLPDDILFPAGSTSLKKEGSEALVSVAEALREVGDRDFVIAGHTDNVPLRRGGRFRDNWELSAARAVEVVKLLTASGMAPERLAAAGFGEFDPVGDNSTAEGRAKNRRLEIILMPRLDELPRLPGLGE
jgi:chemotaxis protein MotB